MAYLVTEVALEMMGYKFFDIDGDAAKLSLNPTINETIPEKAEAGAPNFFQVIGVDEKEMYGPRAITPPPPPPAASDDEPIVSAWGALDPSPPPSRSGSHWAPRPEPPLLPIDSVSRRRVAGQLSEEHNVMRHHVEQQKTAFLKAKGRGAADVESQVQTFMLELRAQLGRDLEIVGNLRMEIEKMLAKSNPDAYDRYKVLFD